jgi:hypothetical protein
MADKRFREAFPTEAEAHAFIKGIEYVDNDHVSTDGPDMELDTEGGEEYAVYVEEFS